MMFQVFLISGLALFPRATNESKAHTKKLNHATTYPQTDAYGHWNRLRPIQYSPASRNSHAW